MACRIRVFVQFQDGFAVGLGAGTGFIRRKDGRERVVLCRYKFFLPEMVAERHGYKRQVRRMRRILRRNAFGGRSAVFRQVRIWRLLYR